MNHARHSANARTFELTDEQKTISDAFNTGTAMVIQAGAGTGKTSTLEVLAEDMARQGRRGIYITLNKAMALEVQNKFIFGNVQCSTIHSLAWRIGSRIDVIAPLLKRINSDTPPVSRFHWHRVIGVDSIFTYTSSHAANRRSRGEYEPDTTMTSQQLMWAAMEALRLWCQSDRADVSLEDVERPVTMPSDVWRASYAPLVLSIARKAWLEDITQPDGQLPFTHDYYLKLVTLAQPQLVEWLDLEPGSVLFFDEAQDSRPCVTQLIGAQRNLQVVAVGDSSQAIYGFTGARDGLPALEKAAGGEVVSATLSTSFRFGQEVADVANDVLDVLDSPLRLTGSPAVKSDVVILDDDVAPQLSEVDAVLVRTNAELLEAAEACMSAGIPYRIVSNMSDIYNVAKDFDALSAGKKAKFTELRDFESLRALEDFLDPQEDSHVKSMASTPTMAVARWLFGHSTREMHSILSAALKEGDDDPDGTVVISTIHKAKGQQWDRVWLSMNPSLSLPVVSTFYDVEVKDHRLVDHESREALMVAYVGVTRAKKTLYMSQSLRTSFGIIRRFVQTSPDIVWDSDSGSDRYVTPGSGRIKYFDETGDWKY